jgi:hypothetical protein
LKRITPDVKGNKSRKNVISIARYRWKSHARNLRKLPIAASTGFPIGHNPHDAHARSILYSLIETCKAHEVDVYSYTKYAISNVIYCDTCEELKKLLPYNCDKKLLSKQRDIPKFNFPQQVGV